MFNAEKIVIGYLTAKLSYPVSAEVPNKEPGQSSPEQFIVVETTGGTYSGLTKSGSANLAVQVYAERRSEANDIALKVHEALLDIPDIPEVIQAEVSVPYNFTQDRPRYQMTLDLMVQDI